MAGAYFTTSIGPDIELWSDASGLGFAAVFQEDWFLGKWPHDSVDSSSPMIVRELYPIALACKLWGNEWCNMKLLFHCDNSAVVDTWKSGSCRNKTAMKLIRLMLAIAAKHNFILYIQHIAGADNIVADCLSRLQVERFRQLAPAANRCPVSHLPLLLT